MISIKTGSSKNNFKVSVKGLQDKILENRFIEVLYSLPEFDYYYRHGEELNRIFTFSFIDNRPLIKTKE